MRKWVAAVLVAVTLAVVFVWARQPVSAQQALPFSAGQRVTLTMESGRSQYSCTVIGIQNDFIGCLRERTVGSDEREIWYNLRFVERIEKRER